MSGYFATLGMSIDTRDLAKAGAGFKEFKEGAKIAEGSINAFKKTFTDATKTLYNEPIGSTVFKGFAQASKSAETDLNRVLALVKTINSTPSGVGSLNALKADIAAIQSQLANTSPGSGMFTSLATQSKLLEVQLQQLKSQISSINDVPVQIPIGPAAHSLDNLQSELDQVNAKLRATNSTSLPFSELASQSQKLRSEIEQLKKEMSGLSAPIPLGPAVQSINSMTSELRELESQLNKTHVNSPMFGQLQTQAAALRNEISALKSPLSNLIPPSAEAHTRTLNGALIDTGRVIQDLPYGIMGVANNIDPLVLSFQRLKSETGSTGAAFKALITGMVASPMGVGIAISAITSLAIVFGDDLVKAIKGSGDKVDDLKQKMKELSEYEDVTISLKILGTEGLTKALLQLEQLRLGWEHFGKVQKLQSAVDSSKPTTSDVWGLSNMDEKIKRINQQTAAMKALNAEQTDYAKKLYSGQLRTGDVDTFVRFSTTYLGKSDAVARKAWQNLEWANKYNQQVTVVNSARTKEQEKAEKELDRVAKHGSSVSSKAAADTESAANKAAAAEKKLSDEREKLSEALDQIIGKENFATNAFAQYADGLKKINEAIADGTINKGKISAATDAISARLNDTLVKPFEDITKQMERSAGPLEKYGQAFTTVSEKLNIEMTAINAVLDDNTTSGTAYIDALKAKTLAEEAAQGATMATAKALERELKLKGVSVAVTTGNEIAIRKAYEEHKNSVQAISDVLQSTGEAAGLSSGFISHMTDAIDELSKGSILAGKTVKGLASAMQGVGSQLGGRIGDALAGMGVGLQAITSGPVTNEDGSTNQTATDLKQVNGYAAIANSLGGLIGGNTGKKVSAVASGASMGASIGSIIPGVGTLIGAGIGALGGLIFGGGRTAEEKAAKTSGIAAQEQAIADLASAGSAAARTIMRMANYDTSAIGGIDSRTLSGTLSESVIQSTKYKSDYRMLDVGNGAGVVDYLTALAEIETVMSGIASPSIVKTLDDIAYKYDVMREKIGDNADLEIAKAMEVTQALTGISVDSFSAMFETAITGNDVSKVGEAFNTSLTDGFATSLRQVKITDFMTGLVSQIQPLYAEAAAIMQVGGDTTSIYAEIKAKLAELVPQEQAFAQSLQDQSISGYAAADAVKAVTEAENAQAELDKTKADLLTQQTSLERQLFEFTHSTTEIRAADLAAMNASLQPAQQRVWLLKDEVDATTAANAASAELNSQIATLERQAFELSHTEAEVRAADIAAMNPALQALQQHVNALKDETSAALNAAAAEKAVADQKYQLETEWLTLIGDTTTLQARALDLISDPTNKALKAQIFALENANKAAAAISTAVGTITSVVDNTAAIFAEAADKAMSVLSKSVSSKKSTLQTAYDSASGVINTSLTLVSDNISKLSSLNSDLSGVIDGLTDTKNLQSYKAAQQEIYTALMLARTTGNLPIDGQIKGALSVVSQDSSKFFGLSTDYKRDLYRTTNALVALNGLTTGAMTDAQQQKSLLETQLTALTDGFKSEQSRLDKIIETAQGHLETGKGTYVVLSSIDQALRAFYRVVGMPNTDYIDAPVINIQGPTRRTSGMSNNGDNALIIENALLRAEVAKGNGHSKDQVPTGMTNNWYDALIAEKDMLRAEVINIQGPTGRTNNGYDALIGEMARLRAEVVKGNGYSKDTADGIGRINQVGVKNRG